MRKKLDILEGIYGKRNVPNVLGIGVRRYQQIRKDGDRMTKTLQILVDMLLDKERA